MTFSYFFLILNQGRTCYRFVWMYKCINMSPNPAISRSLNIHCTVKCIADGLDSPYTINLMIWSTVTHLDHIVDLSDMPDTWSDRRNQKWTVWHESCGRLAQFVIFKPLSYCFEETIGFDVKTSFARRPVSRLIELGNITRNLKKRLFSSTGPFRDWKL